MITLMRIIYWLLFSSERRFMFVIALVALGLFTLYGAVAFAIVHFAHKYW